MKIQFSMESRIWKFFEFLSDVFGANVLFVITCIPVVTIGPSFTALLTVFFHRREKRLAGVRKTYFKAFKENFKQSFIIWIAYLVFLVTCVLNINYNVAAGLGAHKGIVMFFGCILFLLTITVLYALAMVARFQNNLIDNVMKGFIIGILNFPYAFCMIVVIVAAAIITLQSYSAILVAMSIWITIGFGLIGYFYAIMFLRSFRRFTRTEEIPEDAPDELLYQARQSEKQERKARREQRKARRH